MSSNIRKHLNAKSRISRERTVKSAKAKKISKQKERDIGNVHTAGDADFYESLIKHSPYAIVLHSGGAIKFINPKGLALLGATPKDNIIDQPIGRFIHPDFLPLASERLRSLQCPGSFARPAEEVFLRLDGSSIDVEVVTSMILYHGENAFMSIIVDITDRKKNERALKESEEKFRSISDNSPNMIFINKAGKVVYVNPKCVQVLGYTKEEFLSRDFNFMDLILDEDKARIQNIYKKHMQDGVDPEPYEYKLKSRNGSVLEVINTSKLIRFDGETAILGMVTDISLQKKMQRALKESEEHYRNMVEIMPEGVAIHSEGKIVFVNSQVVRLLGATVKDELIGRSVIDFVHPDSKKTVIERMKGLAEKGISAPAIEEKFVRVDGTAVEVEAIADPIIYNDKPAVQVVVRDITERKKNEKAILKNLDLTRQYLDLVGSIVVAIDRDQKITLLNKKGCEVLGVGCSEAIGKNWFDTFIPADERADVKKTFEGILNGSIAPFECHENRVVTKSGERRDISWHNSLLYDDLGRITASLSSGEDITVRKLMEKELLDAKEDKFRKIFDYAKDGILLVDVNTEERKLHMANSAFCKMLGYDQGEIRGLSVRDIHPGKDLERVIDKFEKQVRQEDFVAENIPVKRKDGTVFYADINSAPVVIEGKKYLLGFFRDLSERKKNEYAIQNLNRQIEMILGATKTGLDIIDSDFNIVYIDPEWKKVYGDNKGRKCYEYFMGRDSVCPDCGAQKALETKTPFVSEELLNKEGGRPVQVTTIPFQDSEGRWMVAEVNVDITERKLWEEDKRRASELKASTEIRSRFTSMVSHELRSPLSAIKEGVNIVLEELVGSVNDQQKNLLSMSKRNIDRLARLINNVLDFQKIEAGKMTYNIRANSIKEAIQETCNTMEILAKERNLVLTADVGGDIPDIEFDRDKIIQVLINLVGNAIKATEKGVIAVSAKREGDAVHIAVKDTGMGINKTDLEKLFRPFEQLTFSARKQKGGTGLGLAISKEMVLAHDGKIWAESEEGKGSVFHFTLPILKTGGYHA